MTNIPTSSVVDKFSFLFQGLGNLGEKYSKDDAKPFAIFIPHHVPMPLCAKVKQEFDKMETMQVISRVEEPIPWYVGMVVVPGLYISV